MSNQDVAVRKPIWLVDLRTLFPEDALNDTFSGGAVEPTRTRGVGQMINETLGKHLSHTPDAKIVFLYPDIPETNTDTNEAVAANLVKLHESLCSSSRFTAANMSQDAFIGNLCLGESPEAVTETLLKNDLINGQSFMISSDLRLLDASATKQAAGMCLAERSFLDTMPLEQQERYAQANISLATVHEHLGIFFDKAFANLPQNTGAPKPETV